MREQSDGSGDGPLRKDARRISKSGPTGMHPIVKPAIAKTATVKKGRTTTTPTLKGVSGNENGIYLENRCNMQRPRYA